MRTAHSQPQASLGLPNLSWEISGDFGLELEEKGRGFIDYRVHFPEWLFSLVIFSVNWRPVGFPGVQLPAGGMATK